jgi:protein-L-isoaspartate(D-aspartate) O-methyltransferase
MSVFHKKIERMIERLRAAGIADERVLRAMAAIPRHRFISSAFEFQAYDEKALPIGHGQTISHPYTVAKMTELLEVKKDDKVLEIGTGSGYQAAILCSMGIALFSIEIIKPLADRARETLHDLGFKPALRTADGSSGWPAHAPFNGIIVTAGAPVLPEQLLDQLEEGGRLLIPIGSRDEQQLTMYQRKGERIEKSLIDKVVFVPLLQSR